MATPQALIHSSASVGEIMERHYNDEQIKLIRDVYAKGATEHEFKLFLEVSKRKGLDIFQRQIHLVKRWDGKANREVCEIQTGIDGYRLIADRTGRYEGQQGPYWCGPDGQWVDVWLSSQPPAAAKIGVWRTNCREPFWAVALYSEYVQKKKDGSPNAMWARMPAAQLAKCAEALALRKAFPAEMSGIYTSEEMAQASNPVIDVEPDRPRMASSSPAQIAAPVEPVEMANAVQIAEITSIIKGLGDYKVAADTMLQTLNKLAGASLTALNASEYHKLTSAQAETVIVRMGARLAKFDQESAAAAAEMDQAIGDDSDTGDADLDPKF